MMDSSDSSSPTPEHRSTSVSSPTQRHNITPPGTVLSASPSADCPLLSLPPEIRLRIYDELFQIRKGKLCLGTAYGSWHRIDSTKGYKPKTRTPGRCVGLLITCKQILAEARPVLCANIPLALYYCDTDPMDTETQPVDLTNLLPNVQKIHIRTEFYDMQNLTAEEVRRTLAPFVDVANNATRARELKIDLTIGRVRGQQCIDRVMVQLGTIESNAKTIMYFDMIGRSNLGLNDESFTELLKKLLRVDEMSKIWQMQLEWEKEARAYQMGKLTKIRDKMRRRKSEFELLCSAAGMSPATYYHQHMLSRDVELFQEDYAQLDAARDSYQEFIEKSESKMTGLEQKLRLKASS